MPGLVGLFRHAEPSEAHGVVDRMVAAMRHEDSYVSGSIAVPELALYAGWAVHNGSYSDCLPAWNERKDVFLLLVGEEFGRTSGPGETHHSSERPAVRGLLTQYEALGPRFLRNLNGWFGGLLVDLRRRRAWLFNDRFGLGRLYFAEGPEGLYFASEAKSLLAVRPDLRNIDPGALGEVLALGCTIENRTLFPGVSLLPGGSIWTLAADGPVLRERYFEPDEWASQPPLDESSFPTELASTFAAVLPRYLRDGPDVAMSLTGGLDGRMIMAWAGAPPGSLPCYTFVGEYRDCHDVRVARQVADLCRQTHCTIGIGTDFCKQFAALAERAVFISDGTMDVTGAVELYANRQARSIAPVRLTGNYGSEIVRGNVAFGPSTSAGVFLAPELRPYLEAAGHAFAEARMCGDPTFVAFKQVPWHHYGRFSVEHSQLTPRSPYLDNDLVALMHRAPAAMLRARRPSLEVIEKGAARLARLPTDRGQVIESFPLAGVLRSAIRELSFKAEYAYDYGMPQWLAALDHALAPLHLERLFLGRHKFYHFRVWYRERLAAYVRDVLLDPRSLERPHVDRRSLTRIVEGHVNGIRNHTGDIHQALTVELIYRTLVDRG